MVDSRDHKIYKTVNIAGKNWMAENLAFESEKSVCPYNLEKLCNSLGRLYTILEAQNVCPEGWHLPSSDEWLQLEEAAGSNYDELNNYSFYSKRAPTAASKLKSEVGWYSGLKYKFRGSDDLETVLYLGNNETGFSVVSVGEGFITDEGKFMMGSYERAIYSATFATSTLKYDNNYSSRCFYAGRIGIADSEVFTGISIDAGRVDGAYSDGYYGVSVRCVQD